MVIFLNLDGTAEKVTPEHIYQGSGGVTEVTVISPLPAQTTMQIGFILPNKLYWTSASDGARYVTMQYVSQSVTDKLNTWTYTLPSSVLEQNGDLYVAFNALVAPGNITSYLCKVIVEESVVPNLPSAPDESVYELLQRYLGILDGRTANVPYLVASIQKVGSNAFTYTDNNGVVSEPIILEGGAEAPVPYTAASAISVPLGAWQPVYDSDQSTILRYTVTISAAQHGQMRDGATAHDLWVSFDETRSGVINGAYQSYIMLDDGAIQITVIQPVEMTVRVWNGLSLADTVARSDIAAETARAKAAEAQLQSDINAEQDRAETAEEHLQDQIDELVNTGIDTVAREQIQAESERAKAAETQLQSNIDAEQTRAETTESALREAIDVNTSDIQGLRDDIANEAHFRGLFNSVAALKAAYPTATPNDYAYISGGNIWSYEDNEWQDTGEPVPSTAIPASDLTPLMDGTATAGIEGNYARGDHRHPTDTTRASVTQLNSKVSKNGDTINGDLRVNGITTTNAIELYHATPYIDFHWDNTTSDYNVRIINGEDGVLGITCDKFVCNSDCDFISHGNEFNFFMISEQRIWFGYRGGKITGSYCFGDGTGTGTLANISANEYYHSITIELGESYRMFIFGFTSLRSTPFSLNELLNTILRPNVFVSGTYDIAGATLPASIKNNNNNVFYYYFNSTLDSIAISSCSAADEVIKLPIAI